jgi:hypothetical protein
MLNYLKDKWPELLIVVVLIPLIATILAIGWSMRGALSKIDGTLNGVVTRVDHIAEAIPDLKVKLAYESIEKPFKTLILTGQTYTEGNTLLVPVNIINTSSGNKSIYTAELRDNSDQNALYALSGAVESVDHKAVSLEEMEAYSLETKQSKFAPDNIEKGYSFVVYKDASGVENKLKKAGYHKKASGKAPALAIWNWSAVVDALTSGALTLDQPKK